MRKSILLFVLCCSVCSTALAYKKKIVPEAPLPDSVSKAQKAFLTNGGGNSLAFDEFYSEMKTWGRYQLTGSPSDAQIIIELKYFVVDEGTRVSSATNSYTGQTQVFSRHMTDPQLQLNIYDAKTKDLLWSVTDHRRLARLEKNRDKESVNSADRLVVGLKNRVGSATQP